MESEHSFSFMFLVEKFISAFHYLSVNGNWEWEIDYKIISQPFSNFTTTKAIKVVTIEFIAL